MARSATLTVEGSAANVRVARHFATRLADLVAPEGREFGPSDMQSLALMVSELVSNAVEHGEGAVEVRIRPVGRCLRIEIVDGSAGQPVRRYAMPGALSGRGLEIVERLADSWGWHPVEGGGKLVWFEY